MIPTLLLLTASGSKTAPPASKPAPAVHKQVTHTESHHYRHHHHHSSHGDSSHAPAKVTVPQITAEKAAPKPEAAADQQCSLSVVNIDPADALKMLTAQTGTNLVLLGKSDAKLTLQLEKLPLEEMIHHICAMCDMDFLKIGTTYVLASPDKLKVAYKTEWLAKHPEDTPKPKDPPVERVTETYVSSYVSAAQLVTSLKDLYKDKDIAATAAPNQLSPQIGSQESAKATGTSTEMLTKADDAPSKTLVLSGPKDLVDDAMAMARRLDQPRSQVKILVSIHDISDDALHDLGVTWDFGTESFQESGNKGISFGTFTRGPLTISNALSALDTSGKSKLLASPNVSLLDGEKAFVLIGDRISYPVLVGYSQNNAPIFSKEEERVGIYLQVAASIGTDGTVTLSLYPQVSSITGFLNVNGASYPQVSTREAQTTLRVKSGETIVMGGLYQDNDIAQIEKVPFLSKIPILGEIFQHRKITKTKSQVIITVQPTVLPPITQ